MNSMFIQHWTIGNEIKQDDRRDTRILVDEWEKPIIHSIISGKGESVNSFA